MTAAAELRRVYEGEIKMDEKNDGEEEQEEDDDEGRESLARGAFLAPSQTSRS